MNGSLLLLFSFFSLFSFAQKTAAQLQQVRQRILTDNKVADVVLSAERQTPALISMATGKSVHKKDAAPALLRSYLAVRPGIDELVFSKSTNANDNVEVLQFRQFFKGIPVEHGNYKVMVQQGDIRFMNGAWFDAAPSTSVQPVLTELQALAFAKSAVGATKYAWEEAEELIQRTTDVKLKMALEKEKASYQPAGQLVMIKDFSQTGYARLRLAYKFNIYAAVPLSRAWIYVDAENGKILFVDHILKHVNDEKNKPAAPPSTNATVHTRYGGIQTIKVKEITGTPVVNPALDPNSGLPIVSSHPLTGGDIGYIPGSSTFVLVDDSKGGGIETYDMNAIGGAPVSLPAAVYSQARSFTDAGNNWDSTEHARGGAYGGAAEAENDDIAWDAHWGASVVYDYWRDKHNRLSFDNNNAKIKSYIHYGPAYDNAFWNGEAMTYGDGSGGITGFKALTSLDVCGHEIGHGVCSFTSDLAYVGESGAMNEGFSDIWAACIEHYAMTRAGSTVPFGKYRSFYIGEQIGADYDNPLRRMDNPKAQSNPDTYGGVNWVEPVCSPTLVNDQCGVHTNSGVLNHWFFLLTAGSQNGTRPAGLEGGSYYQADSDDEIRDGAGTANNGGSYLVNGVGFDLSENVTYLTETLLTSTATFAEARSVSIQVAKALTGDDCSPLVQSVTNAWYAVGVGAAFSSPCSSLYGFVYQPGINLGEGTVTTGCTAAKTIYVPVLLPASSTATITAGGTATNGTDYTLSATTLTNASAVANKLDTLTIVIKNDAVVEGNETIALTLAVTNTGGNPVNTNYLVSITDDDVLPLFAADSIVLLNETFTDANTGSPYNMPAGWSEVLELPEVDNVDPTATTGFNHWGVINNSIGVTGKVLGINLADGLYNPLSASRTIIRTNAKLDARGLSNLSVHFDYTVQGELDITSPQGTPPGPVVFPIFDYAALVYSMDGVSWTEVPYIRFASVAPATGTYNAILPAALNNQQFYFGFRWNNDANAGGPQSVSIDNLTLKAAGTKIETVLNHSGAENAAPSSDVYYYSGEDRSLIARLNQQDASNYGCITASVEKAGNSTFTFYTAGTTRHIVGDKVIRVTPASNNPAGVYTITLYYTEAEIAAIEAATAQARTSFTMYKTSAPAYTGATALNTGLQPAVYIAIPGVGGQFTASFSSGFSGFAIGASVSIALPVTCIEFKGANNNNVVNLQWKVSAEINSKGFEVERSMDGITYTTIGSVPYNAANGGLYNFADAGSAGLREAYYRLKQTDRDNSSRYLCSVLRFSFDRKLFSIGNIYPNPGVSDAFVQVYTEKQMRLRIEYINAIGQLMGTQLENVSPGSTKVQLRQTLGAGVYRVRFKDDTGQLLGTQNYYRQ